MVCVGWGGGSGNSYSINSGCDAVTELVVVMVLVIAELLIQFIKVVMLVTLLEFSNILAMMLFASVSSRRSTFLDGLILPTLGFAFYLFMFLSSSFFFLYLLDLFL